MSKSIIAALLLAVAAPATAQVSFTLPAQAAAPAVTALEYFLDSDPGAGNGNALPLAPSADITTTIPLNISALSKGAHRLYLRSRNAAGRWSATVNTVFVIYSKVQALPVSVVAASPVTAAEYFLDTDPGAGSGTPVSLTAGADAALSNIAVNISGLGLGLHTISFRAKNAAGQWSTASRSKFTIIIGTVNTLPATAAGKPITKLEYYLDTDPGFGQGTPLTVAPTTDLSGYSFTADVSGLANGNHTLFVRSLDGLSMTQATGFKIGTATPLPVRWLSFTARPLADSVQLQWAAGDEGSCTGYQVERSEDGRSFRQIGAVTVHTDGSGDYAFTDAHPAAGTNYYRLRQMNQNGASVFSPVVSVRLEAVASLSINNPVQGTLILRRIGKGDVSAITVTTAAGVPALNIPLGENPIQMADVSTLAPGMYLLQWTSNGQPGALRFVKQ